MASDRTSQTGEATAGFVQRPTIPPRSRRVISHSPLEIAAEYRAIVISINAFEVAGSGQQDAGEEESEHRGSSSMFRERFLWRVHVMLVDH